MADAPVVHIGENSPEYVAYKLFERGADIEGKKLYGARGADAATREWVLDAYADCLHTVRGFRTPPSVK